MTMMAEKNVMKMMESLVPSDSRLPLEETVFH